MERKKLIHHEEIEYDFCLEYLGKVCPRKVGDPVESPVTDDRKTKHSFPGFGIVVAVQGLEWGRTPGWMVYVRTYRRIGED